MQKILVIGYGNVDREDDGVGWHVLETLSDHFGSPVATSEWSGPPNQGLNIAFQTKRE